MGVKCLFLSKYMMKSMREFRQKAQDNFLWFVLAPENELVYSLPVALHSFACKVCNLPVQALCFKESVPAQAYREWQRKM